MPSKKKRSSSQQSMSPQQIAAAQRSGFDHAMGRLPPITFDDMFSNFEMFSGSIGDMFSNTFGGLIDRGENTIGVQNPTPAAQQINPNPQPELDPYEARIRTLMATRGMTREQAIANQQNALGLGTDYNNDGAVTDDEWKRYGQTAPGAAYIAQHPGKFNPNRPQPTAPQPGAVQPGMPAGVQLTPEQQAAIQRFQGYGRGVR